MKSNSNLLNYIGLLMKDDVALKNFLVDPITEAEGKYGITKAERAVLRRTLSHLSNKSKNGYTVSRHLGSYRRSLRLLQNVLHNVGSKMVQDVQKDPNDDSTMYSFSVIYNLPVVVTGPVDFTGKTNSFVDQNYGGPYAISTPAYTVQLANQNPTIQEVMDEVNSIYFGGGPVMPYKTVTIGGDEYVETLTPLSTYDIKADLSTYTTSDDYVFWFYSINGKANPSTSGNIGESFADKNLNPGDTVYWQLIAPDSQYGFSPCDATEGAEYNK